MRPSHWLGRTRQASRSRVAEHPGLSRVGRPYRRQPRAHGDQKWLRDLSRGRSSPLSRPLIECVPNFSEGRDPTVIARLVNAISGVTGAAVLHHTSDPDHNRTVITFAGEPGPVTEAAFRAIECAAASIDMTRQHGVHPRIGAADVVPLIPVSGITLEECASLAAQLGERVWRELHVPVYLYEAAARRPERVNLANIRRGRFEILRDEVRWNADRRPDFGDAALHRTAGACVIGARKFLIALNIDLDTPDVAIA